jgi:5-(carboxyamino)imidazole ribonucleotide synthase
MTQVAPGGTIGILGGGQLGRMLAAAAHRLGLKVHIYCQDADEPALDVTPHRTLAAWDDEAALLAFANAVDVVTFEFENVPVATVEFLEKHRPVRPGSKALGVAQDRIKEKWLARDLKAMTANFAGVGSLEELLARIDQMGLPAILKTNRFGYDGKGQAKILERSDAEAAWAAMQNQPSILEGFVPFRSEVSVVAARGGDGAFVPFAVTENVHRNHILHTATAPARLSGDVAAEAADITRRIAEALDYVGVLAVEFFVLAFDGEDVLYVNEIAPRVHNSGHWTQDGAVTSQFEQHIRAVASWPLGSAAMTAPKAVMTNLIGDDVAAWASLAAEPGAHVHLYGKREARPGRKMGHVNRIG